MGPEHVIFFAYECTKNKKRQAVKSHTVHSPLHAAGKKKIKGSPRPARGITYPVGDFPYRSGQRKSESEFIGKSDGQHFFKLCTRTGTALVFDACSILGIKRYRDVVIINQFRTQAGYQILVDFHGD